MVETRSKEEEVKFPDRIKNQTKKQIRPSPDHNNLQQYGSQRKGEMVGNNTLRDPLSTEHQARDSNTQEQNATQVKNIQSIIQTNQIPPLPTTAPIPASAHHQRPTHREPPYDWGNGYYSKDHNSQPMNPT
jgi:hypothetical protein